MSKLCKVSSFWLKIIALIFMTFNHFVVLYCLNGYYFPANFSNILYQAGLYLGPISFTLFAFMISEGMEHTSNRIKYLLRLGIMTIVLTVITIIIEKAMGFTEVQNIFWDLTLGAALIYCLELPQFKKFFILIPVAIIATLLANNYTNFMTIHCLKLSYGIYGVLLILVFYLSKLLCQKYIEYSCNKMGMDIETFKESSEAQLWRNFFAFCGLLILSLCGWVVYFVYPEACTIFWNYHIYAILTGILIIFYNGKRGYNAKWFQYGCYLYYPLHILILYLFTLI